MLYCTCLRHTFFDIDLIAGFDHSPIIVVPEISLRGDHSRNRAVDYVSDVELDGNLPLLAREAYLWLHRLATDRTATDSPRFWAAWEVNRQAVMRLIAETGCR